MFCEALKHTTWVLQNKLTHVNCSDIHHWLCVPKKRKVMECIHTYLASVYIYIYNVAQFVAYRYGQPCLPVQSSPVRRSCSPWGTRLQWMKAVSWLATLQSARCMCSSSVITLYTAVIFVDDIALCWKHVNVFVLGIQKNEIPICVFSFW